MFEKGVIIENFGKPFYEALPLAAKLGFSGIQLYASGGMFDPETISDAELERAKSCLRDEGLKVCAVCGELGGHGFAIAKDNPKRIVKSRKILELAISLGAKIVTTHIGVIPEDPAADAYRILWDAMAQLGEFAAERGCCFAIETGPEPVATLKRFLADVNSPGIAVNYDPANLRMVTGEDEVRGVYELAGKIVHTHAKDGLPGKLCDPGRVYDYFAGGGVGDLNLRQYFTETPLGQGGVRFPEYLAALADIGYEGYLTVERELTADPVRDIQNGLSFLNRQIAELFFGKE